MSFVVVGAPFGLSRSHWKQRLGAIQSLDLRLIIDAQHQRAIRRVEIEPTMSRTFSTNSGSLDSLNVSLRCGCSENARQMRCTVETDRPDALAIERVLQCVAAAGMVSKVVVTTSVILSSPILRGAPGRGRRAAH